MITSKEYPDCPECDGINYPTFDHETGARAQEEYADYTLYCEFSKDVNKLDTFQKYRYFKKIFARALLV